MQMTKIIDMKPFMNDVNCTFIVLERLPQTATQGSTTQYLVADESACIHLHIWEKEYGGNPSTQPSQDNQKKKEDTVPIILNPGDICRILNGHCTIWKSSLGLYIGRKGTIERLGEFCMIFNEQKNISTVEFNVSQHAENKRQMQM